MRFPLPSIEYRRFQNAIWRFIGYVPLTEPNTTNLLKTLLRPTDIFVDVGANKGHFCTTLKPYVNQMYAIEPIPYLAKRIRSRGIETFNLAASDIEGEAYFYITKASGQSSLYPKRATRKIIKTKTSRLDTLFSKIDVLKIDVEGAESLVLKGCGDITPRVICVEFYPDHEGFDKTIYEDLSKAYSNHIGCDLNIIYWETEKE